MIEDDPKTGPADVSRTLTEAMERAGVHPAYVAAVRVCGFVFTEENAHTFTASQVAQWNLALEQWFADHAETGADATPAHDPEVSSGLGNGRSGH